VSHPRGLSKPTGPNQPELDAGQTVRSLVYSPLLDSSYIDKGTLTQMLREFLSDNTAVFRSAGQQEALYAIIKHIPYLYLILPTASGKTTLFLFGASLLPNQV